jgi:hypothetical protein
LSLQKVCLIFRPRLKHIHIAEVKKMEKRRDRRTLAAAAGICLLLVVAALALAFTLTPTDVAVFGTGSTETAALTLRVLEGYTESPIENATVVILETEKTYKTNGEGLTEVIEVPVIRDSRYDTILEKPWGEVSMIIYKDGFVPYALFYLQVLGGETREGVKILLFEQGSTDSEEPFSIIEGPNRVWVNQLVEMYRPK